MVWVPGERVGVRHLQGRAIGVGVHGLRAEPGIEAVAGKSWHLHPAAANHIGAVIVAEQCGVVVARRDVDRGAVGDKLV